MVINRIWILIGKKVSGEATRQELEELDCLMADGSDGAQTIGELEHLWQNANTEPTPKTAEEIHKNWLNFKTRLPAENKIIKLKTRSKFKWRLVAACILILLTAGIATFFTKYNFNEGNQITIVEAPAGATTEIKLPDGSKVWLNAHSKLTYKKQFGEKFREVSLAGEAFFDVVKDSDHPFIVSTSTLHLKVLGTAFNVRSFPDEKKSEAALVRGAIEVTLVNNPDKKIILKPSEKIIVRNSAVATAAPKGNNQTNRKSKAAQIPLITLSNIHYKEADPLPVEAQWIERKLAFESENLEDIAARMERYYGVNIKFNDESVKSLVFSGSFKDETVTEAISALQTTGGYQFSAKIHNDQITIYK